VSDTAAGVRGALSRIQKLNDQGILELAPLGSGCRCVTQHSPAAYVLVKHHIKPKSWGGPDTVENLVDVCPNSHSAVHRLIDSYVRAKGDPGWEVRRKFSAFQRELALRAWEQRPPVPTYTLGYLA
jgi:hypothetical protein